MSEIRPWIGALVSVAGFRIVRDLRIVDCSRDKKSYRDFVEALNGRELDPAGREEAVWGDICEAFSRPVNRDDKQTDYVPTQIIAELFQVEGQDGLLYKSSQRIDGYNLLLYDQTAVERYLRRVFKVEAVDFRFKEEGATPGFRPEPE